MSHSSHDHEEHESHAAHGGNAPSDAGATAVHGDPHALPPEPASRFISPAPEDFAATPPVRNLMWPFAWAAVVLVAWLAVRSYGWRVPEHATHGEPAEHGAPADHGVPEHGDR